MRAANKKSGEVYRETKPQQGASPRTDSPYMRTRAKAQHKVTKPQ
jgi:hypothetical protein